MVHTIDSILLYSSKIRCQHTIMDKRKMKSMKIFQDRLIEQRKLNKLTQRQIAESLGVAQPSYIRYENGSAEPTLEALVKLADLFDVSVDYLLGRKEY